MRPMRDALSRLRLKLRLLGLDPRSMANYGYKLLPTHDQRSIRVRVREEGAGV